MKKFSTILFKSLLVATLIGFVPSCKSFKRKTSSESKGKLPPPEYRYGTFKFKQKPDEVYLSPVFMSFLKANPFCSVVLRVPIKSGNVVEEEASFNRSMYFSIEKILLKNNFKVKDRSLFEKRYQENATKTDTDLILELVTFKHINYYTNKVIPETSKEEEESTLPAYFYFKGAYAEFKITNIATNEVVATFVLNYTPCTKGCKMKYSTTGEIKTLESDFKTTKKNGYESIDLDEDAEMFSELANRLVAELRKDIK
jgi:hypothetical protein